MENDNLIEAQIQENDWILNKIARKMKLKFSGEEDIFKNNKDNHKFFNRIVKVNQFGLIILFFGKNLMIVDDNMIAILLEQDVFDEKYCSVFKFDVEILRVFLSQNEKFLSVLLENSLLIFNTVTFLESKDEKIKEDYSFPISVNDKQNIFFDFHIYELLPTPFLFVLNRQSKYFSIYDLNNNNTLIREFKSVLLFDVFEKKNLIFITEDFKLIFNQIEIRNSGIQTTEKTVVDLTLRLDLDISSRGYVFSHLQSLNSKFISIISQYYEKDDEGNLEYYTTSIYFIEIESLTVKKVYMSDELFNYNSNNDFKDFPKYDILYAQTVETEIFIVNNSHNHKTVTFHYDDIDDTINKCDMNDEIIIATIYDKDLNYMSLFCGMVFYDFQIRKYLNNVKINVNSEEFKRPPLVICATNLGDLIIYYYINRRELEPKLVNNFKNINIKAGKFKRSFVSNKPIAADKNESVPKPNSTNESVNFNKFMNVNNKNKSSTNVQQNAPQRPSLTENSIFNIQNNENTTNTEKKNDIKIEKNIFSTGFNQIINNKGGDQEDTSKKELQSKKKEEEQTNIIEKNTKKQENTSSYTNIFSNPNTNTGSSLFSNVNTNSNISLNLNTIGNTNTSSNLNVNTNVNKNLNPTSNTNSNFNINTNSNKNTISNSNSNSNTNSISTPNTIINNNTNKNTNKNTNTNIDINKNTYSNTDSTKNGNGKNEDFLSYVYKYTNFELENTFLPIIKKLEDRLDRLDDEFESNKSYDNIRSGMINLCNKLKDINSNLIKKDDFEKLMRKVDKTGINFKESEMIFKELQNKNTTEKELNDYLENMPEFRKINEVNKKYNLKYAKLKNMVEYYGELLQELSEHSKQLGFPYLEEQIRLSKKYEGTYSKLKKGNTLSSSKISESVMDKYLNICAEIKKKEEEISNKIAKIQRDIKNPFKKGFSVNHSEDIQKSSNCSINDESTYCEPLTNQNHFFKINARVCNLINSCQGTFTIFNDFNSDTNFEDFYNERRKNKQILDQNKDKTFNDVNIIQINNIIEKLKLKKKEDNEVIDQINSQFERRRIQMIAENLPDLRIGVEAYAKELLDNIPKAKLQQNQSKGNINLPNPKKKIVDALANSNKKEENNQTKSVFGKVEQLNHGFSGNQNIEQNRIVNNLSSNINPQEKKEESKSLFSNLNQQKKEEKKIETNSSLFNFNSNAATNNIQSAPLFGKNLVPDKKEENKNNLFNSSVVNDKNDKQINSTSSNIFNNIPNKTDNNVSQMNLFQNNTNSKPNEEIKKENDLKKNVDKSGLGNLSLNNKSDTNVFGLNNLTNNLNSTTPPQKDNSKQEENKFSFGKIEQKSTLFGSNQTGSNNQPTEQKSGLFGNNQITSNNQSKEQKAGLFSSNQNTTNNQSNEQKSSLFGNNQNASNNESTQQKSSIFGNNQNTSNNQTNTASIFNNTSTLNTSNILGNANQKSNTNKNVSFSHSGETAFGAKSSLVNNLTTSAYANINPSANFTTNITSSNVNNPKNNTTNSSQQSSQQGFQNFSNQSSGFAGFSNNNNNNNTASFFASSNQNSGFVGNQNQNNFLNNQQNPSVSNQNKNKSTFFVANKDNDDFF